MRDIGKNIRAARVRKQMTQDALAERLHVSRQTVSNYETSRSRPDIDMLLSIAEALNTDVSVLLYGTPVPPEKCRECRTLLMAVIATLVFGGMLLLVKHWLQGLSDHFITGPVFVMNLLLLPCFYALLGWTLFQACGTALGARPLQGGWVKPVHWAILVLFLAYLVLMTPLAVYDLRTFWELSRLRGTQEPYSYSSSYQFLPIWDALVMKLMRLLHRRSAVFILFGAAFHATRPPVAVKSTDAEKSPE